MKIIIKIISNNFFISLIVALIIIYFLPQIFNRYKVEIIEKGTFTDRRIYYYDLDNDGKSECIRFGYKVNPFVFILNNDHGRIMQWNLSGNWAEMSEITFGDYDNNGFNEIYAFTEYEDSIFCNSLELLADDSASIHRKYIASVRKHNNKQDFGIANCFFIDCNEDNYKEIIFPITAGFPLQPRNLFAYDIFQDTVYKSPKSGAYIYTLMPYDLDNDGKEEIIANWTCASSNFPVDFPYIDHSAWLMVFNNKLDFIFEPVGFEGYTSSIIALPYRVKDKVYIAALYDYIGKENKMTTLYLYNNKGQKLKERVLKENKKARYNYNIVTINPEKRDELYLTDKDGNIEKLNENLKTIKKVNVKLIQHPRYMLDVDNDNKEELLFWGDDPEKLIIERNDYSNIIFEPTPYYSHFYKNIITVKLNGDKPPHLSIQQGDKWVLLQFMTNFLYYLKYLIYLGIYLGIFLFIRMVQKINAYRLEQENKKLEETVKLRTVKINEQKEELFQTLEELRTTQEQLIESEKMASLGNLVAGVAHEINTPVGIGITASSSLVEQTKQFAVLYRSGQMTREQLEEYLENIYQDGNLILKNMNRTGELVRSFKQVSVDQMTEGKRKFQLKSYINDIILSLKPEFQNKQIKIAVETHGYVKTNGRSSLCDDIEIDSYPGIIAQIITNLVLNSVRHGFRDRDSGDITIIVSVGTNGASTPLSNPRASIHIQYKDNGCGIPEENLPKIFDPFFTTNKQIGTGLGLHIVYNLVTQKLKGTVSCDSKEGKGVLFAVDIPEVIV
ncbi:MAG: hypothetical protein HY738_01380 [Bacteroidia bacterium]|nr:hypothetical protein [Bacteroidia bacterium]